MKIKCIRMLHLHFIYCLNFIMQSIIKIWRCAFINLWIVCFIFASSWFIHNYKMQYLPCRQNNSLLLIFSVHWNSLTQQVNYYYEASRDTLMEIFHTIWYFWINTKAKLILYIYVYTCNLATNVILMQYRNYNKIFLLT